VTDTLTTGGTFVAELGAARRHLITRTRVEGPHTQVETWSTEAELEKEETVLEAWSLAAMPPKHLGRRLVRTPFMSGWVGWNYSSIDPTGTWLAHDRWADVEIVPLRGLETAAPKIVGRHSGNVVGVAFHPDGNQVVSADNSGEVRIWSRTSETTNPLRDMRVEGQVQGPLRFDDAGRWLGTTSSLGWAYLWDLWAPVGQEPIELRGFEGLGMPAGIAIHPRGKWVATGTTRRMALWPLGRRYPTILQGLKAPVGHMAFAPDGSWLVYSSGGAVRLWSLSGGDIGHSRVLYDKAITIWDLAVDPLGRHVLVRVPRGADTKGQWKKIDVRDGSVTALPNLLAQSTNEFGFAISPDGSVVAQATGEPGETTEIRIDDLETGKTRFLDLGHEYKFGPIVFLPDGRLAGDTYDDSFAELRAYNLEDGSFERILGEGIGGNFAFSRDGRYLVNHRTEGPLTSEPGVITVEEGRWILNDLQEGTTRVFPEVGNIAWPYSFDPAGKFLAVSRRDGSILVSYADGKRAHLMLGHKSRAHRVAVDPKGRWIATATLKEHAIRLWPIPEGEPFHTLPHEELLERLRALTNIRVVKDEESQSGYRIDYAEFPGWETVPTW
jgi:WD40 repeat protein